MLKNEYHVVGLMSGTSLDGLDMAYCSFTKTDKWAIKLLASQTVAYDISWKDNLRQAHHFSASKLMALDASLAALFAKHINDFISAFSTDVDFISSHGHTIFHQPLSTYQTTLPLNGPGVLVPFTTQIASGAIIAALTGLDVVSDFRSADVALGGQGAPLVPIGDALLFENYDYCLNLGGIANISFETKSSLPQSIRMASDLCFANMGLNFIAALAGFDFDCDGKLAAMGTINTALLDQLNALEFHHQNFPKSIGKEYFEQHVQPLLSTSQISINDLMRTFCEHILIQVKNNLTIVQKAQPTILVTGGGAHNKFLMELFKQHLPAEIVLPSKDIIDFKEAILFGFLGVLRVRGEHNTLRTVTGASINTCSGALYKGQKNHFTKL